MSTPDSNYCKQYANNSLTICNPPNQNVTLNGSLSFGYMSPNLPDQCKWGLLPANNCLRRDSGCDFTPCKNQINIINTINQVDALDQLLMHAKHHNTSDLIHQMICPLPNLREAIPWLEQPSFTHAFSDNAKNILKLTRTECNLGYM